jgi:hypothetical protein
VSGDQSSATVVVRVTDFVTPATGNLAATIVATPVGAGSAVTANTTTAADGTFTSDITITGGPGITSVNATTTVNGADGSANCGVDISTGGETITCSDGSVVPIDVGCTTIIF